MNNVLNRYKIGIVEERKTFVTVYAHNEQEAVELIKSGNGRHAGVSEPKVVRLEIGLIGGFDDPQTGENPSSVPPSPLILPGK